MNKVLVILIYMDWYRGGMSWGFTEKQLFQGISLNVAPALFSSQSLFASRIGSVIYFSDRYIILCSVIFNIAKLYFL